MNSEKLLRSIGEIDDKYIKEATLQQNKSTNQQTKTRKKWIFRLMPIAASFIVCLLATTAFAANTIQNTLGEFYLRYLSTEDMAVADSIAESVGAKIYFDGLKSGDWYKTYFSINKLVEYYNDESVRQEAIKAITPFLTDANEKISDAAKFALSILTQTFDDPRIFHMADGSLIFTLFNDYSDYGTYNRLWQITDGEMTERMSFDKPHMYIRQIIQSPDAKLLAVLTISNKSEYVVVHDYINGYVSSELVDSARILAAKDMGCALRQRMDFENYCGAENIHWIDNTTLEFHAYLSGDIEIDGELQYGGFFEQAIVRYNSEQRSIEYSLISTE